MSLVLLSYWRHPEYTQNLWGPVNNASWSCLPFSLFFLPISLFPFFSPPFPCLFPLSCSPLPFPGYPMEKAELLRALELSRREGGSGQCCQWGEAQAVPAAARGWGHAASVPPFFPAHCWQVVLVGRDAAWVDIYSCFLRKPGLSEELCSSVGLSWVRDSGSGNGRKASLSQQQGKFSSQAGRNR